MFDWQSFPRDFPQLLDHTGERTKQDHPYQPSPSTMKIALHPSPPPKKNPIPFFIDHYSIKRPDWAPPQPQQSLHRTSRLGKVLWPDLDTTRPSLDSTWRTDPSTKLNDLKIYQGISARKFRCMKQHWFGTSNSPLTQSWMTDVVHIYVCLYSKLPIENDFEHVWLSSIE